MGQRRTFSREFKLEAVKLLRERGVSVAQACRDLDLHENVLRKWMRQQAADPKSAFPGHGQMEPEQQEIERLRREVVKLNAERDTLKNVWPAPFARANFGWPCRPASTYPVSGSPPAKMEIRAIRAS